MSDSKTVFVIGGTGLIGRSIVSDLLDSGYIPVVLSRNPSKAKKLFRSEVDLQFWDGSDADALTLLIAGARAIINLAGESIAVRWTKAKKASILRSRLITTNAIVTAIRQSFAPPEVFIQASAIGYYKHNSGLPIDEDGPLGDGFLSNVVMQWEQVAEKVESRSRLVIIRTGVVLSADGGFLSRIVFPVRFFIGGWFGEGTQKLSWIHIKDHVRATRFLLENDRCKGVYNLVSEEPTIMKTFVKRIGTVLSRPAWLPMPIFLLKLVFGEMVNEVILSNQHIVPKRLVLEEFRFDFNHIEAALDDLLNKRKL